MRASQLALAFADLPLQIERFIGYFAFRGLFRAQLTQYLVALSIFFLGNFYLGLKQSGGLPSNTLRKALFELAQSLARLIPVRFIKRDDSEII